MARRKKAEVHHGGAWKVAYADFVTAMMAFFLVMWILSLGKPVKEAIAAYFNDPFVFMKGADRNGANAIPVKWPSLSPETPTTTTTTTNATTLAFVMPASDKKKRIYAVTDEKKVFRALKAEMQNSLEKLPAFKNLSKNIQFDFTNEGLRIEMPEDRPDLFFTPGSGEIGQPLSELIGEVAKTLQQMNNRIVVEGHTDASPTNDPKLTNWELSTERANSARRLMETLGLGPQICQVRGFAAQRPLAGNNPGQASNRRVSLVLLYTGMEKKLGQVELPTFDEPAFGMGTERQPELKIPVATFGDSLKMPKNKLKPKLKSKLQPLLSPGPNLESDQDPKPEPESEPKSEPKPGSKPSPKKPKSRYTKSH